MGKRHHRRGRGHAPAARVWTDSFEENVFSSSRGERSSSSSPRRDHKTQQLCRQVSRALSLALAGECGDPILQDLVVHSVVPAPNASRLLVNVYLSTTHREDVPVWQILAALEGAGKLLRREVTAAIVRKRAPELEFQIVSPDMEGTI